MTRLPAVLRVRPVASWTLRARLVTSLAAVLAVVCVVIGAVTAVSLRGFLVHQLDDRLSSAATRSVQHGQQPGQQGLPGDGGRPGLPPGLFAPGQGEGTLAAQLTGGRVEGLGRIDAAGRRDVVAATPAITRALLAVRAGAAPSTAHLPGLGDYRVIATTGPGGTTVVTGLPLASVTSTVNRLWMVIGTVVAFGLVVAVLLALVIVRVNLRPLRRVAAAATRVSQLRLDQGEVAVPVRVAPPDTDPRTEVGQVGSSLNHLIGHVESALAARQASETRVRHFVADASHELRTPLAAIRGYAELTRPQRGDLPPQVAQALERVDSAAERMTTLVEDLLLLARLDAGRPIETEPVDFTELVIGAVSDAHAASAEHRWQLDLPDEPVVVEGDRLRLHQVVANLLSNARTHTPPGTTVTVTLRADPVSGAVALHVDDDGPGIPEALRPTVFERFARGDSSRSRAAGSSGLGLAIVTSVVAAHHGRVGLASRPGATRFIVELPAQQPARVVTAGT